MLEGLEREAREAKKGLWADPKLVPPWEWRKAEIALMGRLISWRWRAWLQPGELSAGLESRGQNNMRLGCPPPK